MFNKIKKENIQYRKDKNKLYSEITNQIINDCGIIAKNKQIDIINDETVINVIQKLLKDIKEPISTIENERKKELDKYTNENDKEKRKKIEETIGKYDNILIEKNKSIKFLQDFLPKPLSKKEIEKIIEKDIEIKNIKNIMTYFKEKYNGQFSNSDLKEICDKILKLSEEEIKKIIDKEFVQKKGVYVEKDIIEYFNKNYQGKFSVEDVKNIYKNIIEM